jgi:hypothetical protein
MTSGQRRKREQAIAALLSSRTIADAAQACRLGERTLKRWLATPEFQEEFRQAKKESLRAAAARLNAAAGMATETLKAIADDPTSPAAARVTAARTILESAMRDRELDDLESRISQLEQNSNGGNK